MKNHHTNTDTTWRCDLCGRAADTLYFAGAQEICEHCRRDRPSIKPKRTVLMDSTDQTTGEVLK